MPVKSKKDHEVDSPQRSRGNLNGPWLVFYTPEERDWAIRNPGFTLYVECMGQTMTDGEEASDDEHRGWTHTRWN